MKVRTGSSSRIYSLVVLSLVSMVSVMDRTVVSIVQEPIRHEFNLSDSALGILSGLAFSIPYVVLAMPFGVLADRVERTRLLAGALAFWSLATVACGLSISYLQLLAARIAVASGEASGAPAQQALVADLFPRERRGTAFGFYLMSLPIGVMLATLIGGVVGARFGWRAAFFVTGVPGLLLSLIIVTTMRASRRSAVVESAVHSPPVREVAKFILSQRSLLHVVAATILGQLAIGANGVWMPSFFVRNFHMNIQEVGLTFGWVAGIGGILGIGLGGVIADRAARHDPRAAIWVIAGSLLLICPTTLLTLSMPNPNAAFAGFGLYLTTALIWMAGASALVQNLAGTARRATVSAFSITLVGLLGSGLAPWLSGALSDALRPYAGEDALRWSLTCFCFFGVWAALHMVAARRGYVENLKRAEEPATDDHPGAE